MNAEIEVCMQRHKNILSYILDQWFSLMRYTPAWVRPSVFYGYFEEREEGYFQELFFQELLRQGFKRTHWQLVLPGQTAGLVRKVEPPSEGMVSHQYHARFYEDGTIDCEFEPHNFSLHHFSLERIVDANLLVLFLEQSRLSVDAQRAIQKLFTTKEHNWSAIRRSRQLG